MTVDKSSSRIDRKAPDAKLATELDQLRRALAASQQQLAVALAEKDVIEALLRASEELFRTRGAELTRYQAELEAANERLRGLVVTDDLTGCITGGPSRNVSPSSFPWRAGRNATSPWCWRTQTTSKR